MAKIFARYWDGKVAERPIFDEIRQATAQQPCLRFNAFSRTQLKRVMAETDV